MDELVGDIKGIIGEIGLPKEELILEIEKIRYKISREARNSGFANTHIPDIINFLNSILVIFLYLNDMTSLKIIQYFNEKFGCVPAMLIGSILLLLNYLRYTFKDKNYEEIVNKYHDFLIRVINSSDF